MIFHRQLRIKKTNGPPLSKHGVTLNTFRIYVRTNQQPMSNTEMKLYNLGINKKIFN